MKYNYRIAKLEKKIAPQQREPIVIKIESKENIDIDLVRIDFNKNNGTNYTLADWKKMDIIISRSYTECELKDWTFETIITNGETENDIYMKYPKLYRQYLVKVRIANELMNQAIMSNRH
jgi:hypothetical protein